MRFEASLEDISILELGTTITGPYTAEILGAVGADVVKVEPPNGDPFRELRPKTDDGVSGQFAMFNCGKRSVKLDLKSDEGRDIFFELAEKADVLIENFTPGAVDRLGIDYDSLREVNDELIYCSISGYGEAGLDSDRPGFGPILQAETGLMSVTGEPNRPPVRVGAPVIDFMTAIWAAFGTMNAIRKRDRTGEGSYVEISMYDTGMSLLAKRAAHYFVTGENPQRMGTQNRYAVPFGAYPTADGERVMIVAPYQPMWETLCEKLGREELIEDERFATLSDRVENREAVNEILTEAFRTEPRGVWLDRFEEGNIPAGPVLTVAEALESDQAADNGVVSTIDRGEGIDPLNVLNVPLTVDDERQTFTTAPPDLGAHSREVLAEIGFDDETIDHLATDDII